MIGIAGGEDAGGLHADTDGCIARQPAAYGNDFRALQIYIV